MLITSRSCCAGHDAQPTSPIPAVTSEDYPSAHTMEHLVREAFHEVLGRLLPGSLNALRDGLREDLKQLQAAIAALDAKLDESLVSPRNGKPPLQSSPSGLDAVAEVSEPAALTERERSGDLIHESERRLQEITERAAASAANASTACRSTPSKMPKAKQVKLTATCSGMFQWAMMQLTVPPDFERRRKATGRVGRFVNSAVFSVVTGLLITANAAFVGFYTDFTLNNELSRISGGSYQKGWWLPVQFFNVVFFVEMLLRALAEGKNFFFGKDALWNVLDSGVVLLSTSDFYFTLTRGADTVPATQFAYLRIIRVFRMISTMKLFRLPVFSHLRMITAAMAQSLAVCFWAVVVFAAILYLFSVAFALGVAGWLRKIPDDYSSDPEISRQLGLLTRYFGGLGATIMNLYMAITGGIDWENIYLSMEALSNTYRFCFLIFTVIMLFLVINIVVGMVIERAFKVVKQDRDFWILEATHQASLYEDRVRGLFHQMDLDVSGEVSWDEFSDALNNPHVEAYLSFIELDTANLYEIFQLLDKDGNETIEVDEFLDGIHELKGTSTKVQLKLVRHLLEDLWEQHPARGGAAAGDEWSAQAILDQPVNDRSSENRHQLRSSGSSALHQFTSSQQLMRRSIKPAPPESSGTMIQFHGMRRSVERVDTENPEGRGSTRLSYRRSVDGNIELE